MQSIQKSFPVTDEEYYKLDEQFGKYCHYIAWKLKKCNTKNNTTDEQEDIAQQLNLALMRAASYYKRQTYIEGNFEVLDNKIKDEFNKKLFEELLSLWNNRTKHGANRQKFGPFQELLLERLVKKYVSKKDRPNKSAPLNIDKKFATYAKQICWNEEKALGRKITREKPIRTGTVSLSSFDYLGSY